MALRVHILDIGVKDDEIAFVDLVSVRDVVVIHLTLQAALSLQLLIVHLGDGSLPDACDVALLLLLLGSAVLRSASLTCKDNLLILDVVLLHLLDRHLLLLSLVERMQVADVVIILHDLFQLSWNLVDLRIVGAGTLSRVSSALNTGCAG